MRLSISNIAWDVTEDKDIVSLLHRYSIDSIDIAPGKYFPNPLTATIDEIIKVKEWWSENNIEITGMQALLFGTSGLNIFGSADVQNKMLEHLAAVCWIAAGLGVKNLVFGSPKNRDRNGLDAKETLDIALSFFQRLGGIAEQNNVNICLEPNPVCYGANFMTTSTETADIVSQIAHPSIKMQLDTGALTINNESPEKVVAKYASLIGHIHLSESDLLPLGDGGTDHQSVAKAIKSYLPNHIATIEMLTTSNEPHLASVERSLALAVNYYRYDGKRN